MGLIKTAAKVAVASSVHGGVQRRQQNRWAEQDTHAQAAQAAQPGSFPQPSAPATEGMDAKLTQLARLGELKAAGVLTEAEFESTKARILSS